MALPTEAVEASQIALDLAESFASGKGRHPHVVVGFSTPKAWNPVSWAIRGLTRSRTSHAWLLVYDPVFKLLMVMEAHSTGMRLVPLGAFKKVNRVVALARPHLDLARGLHEAGKWLGEPFDKASLVGMTVVLLGRWLRRKWSNPFHRSDALFCSESVVRMLQEAGYPGAADLDPSGTSPEDLLELLERDTEHWRVDTAAHALHAFTAAAHAGQYQPAPR
jgi:hypothetical protein